MLAQYLSYEFIALFMFITMLVMMFTGQRVFGAIGFVAAASALLIWGEGSMGRCERKRGSGREGAAESVPWNSTRRHR